MKSILSFAIVAALTFSASAAEAPKPEGGKAGRGPGRRQMNPERRIEQMKENLGLTEDQVTKVRAVYAKHQPEFKSLREDTAKTAEEKKTKMQELNRTMRQEVGEILTPEQKKKARELAQARGGKAKQQ